MRAVPSFFLIDATSTQDETDDVVPTGNVVGTIGGYHVFDFFFANDAEDLDMPFSNVVVQYAEVPKPARMDLLPIGADAMLLRRR